MKPLLALLALAALAAGCGGSKTASPPTTTTPTTAAAPATITTPATTGAQAPSPLQAEAAAAATGDIPDNQVFLRFDNASAGYSMKYPEGWAQQGSGPTVTFRDKNNIVRIVVKPGGAATPADATRDLAAVTGATITGGPAATTISGKPAVKVSYTTQSAANSVTGKRLTLIVDRYYLWKNGKRAVVDLGTPRGVDNVDAYRLMIESFTWK
ncbi:MAG: hypothetical protein QOI27_1237 [Gaiellaceae bacterium]|nr:hypothetical protein [Gaiellaceae bacterium]